MNYQSLAKLEKKLAGYPQKVRDFLFAILSDPWTVSPDNLRQMARLLGMTLLEGQKVLKTLRSDGFITEGSIEIASEYYGGWRLRLAPEAWLAALKVMRPLDVTTCRYEAVYADGVSEPEKKACRAADYEGLFLLMVSEKPVGEKIPVGVATASAVLQDRFEELWLEMIRNPRWKNFFAVLPQAWASQVVLDLGWHTADDCTWAEVEAIVSATQAMAVTEEEKAKVSDWATFRRFWREGHPEDQLKRMKTTSQHFHLMQAVVSLLAGDAEAAMKAAKKGLRERPYENYKYFCGYWENFVYGLALYADRQTPTTQRSMGPIVRNIEKLYAMEAVLGLFALLGSHSEPGKVLPGNWTRRLGMKEGPSVAILALPAFAFHVSCVFGREPGTAVTNAVKAVAKDYPVIEQLWTAVTDPGSEKLEEYEKVFGMNPLIAYQRRAEPWEAALQELLDFTALAAKKKTSAGSGTGPAARVYYLLDTANWQLTPRLQKTKNGTTWSAGRDIGMKAFMEKAAEAMTPQDCRVADALSVHRGWGNTVYYEWDKGRAMAALVGHPHVFDAANAARHLEIVKGELQLSVTKEDEGFAVHTNIEKEKVFAQCAVKASGDGKVEVVEISDEKRKFLDAFKKAGDLPKAAEPMLTKILERLSTRMPVMSELLKNSEVLAKQKGDSRITLQISPADDGFAVRAVVRPVAGAAVVCEPGKGLEYLAVNVAGNPVQVARSLKKEKAAFASLMEKLSFLDDSREDETRWQVTTEGCLELLGAVFGLKDVTVEWPEGVKFRVTHAALGFSDLQLSVNRMGNWFEVSGAVALDGKTKLKVTELLRLVREAKGNFIELGKGDFVALTESLKKQLAALDRVAGGSGTKTPQVSVFNTGLLGELEKNGAEIKADKAFRDLQERVNEAADVDVPVPAGLTAELRDYQEDGFRWMSRLAAWGAGAVLADDMGLGKTVQTIAVLASRAAQGPQLVVVPASVLLNWRDELTRFAPGLKQVILNLAGDRADVLKKAKAGTVVVTTYGILTSEVETLAEKMWTTAVFDEAHNVKNKETKSFKAAAEVKADFRIMLTGTPLQNHLAEIWALFEIAVPGLLGSFNRFTDRFVLPIERDKDREQQRLLKRLVSPFILRRTKTDVLNELPEKTEMTVKVELAADEKALYEELREETQMSLENGEINAMQALTSLMRLRQAACSAELIDPALTIPSSKTQAFLKLTDELIENRHRALVFSQFTSHLALIRRALDEKGIKYLYLDGSMSPAQRMKLVEAFENGEMPLFLISLKAGGTGLNLTAADYVIHMDPWWNPAIENQASDRAYRIGQERPVTIYRLIAAGTVEEKILKLHATKKSLADALLEGTEMSSRLGREEIMELLSLAK